MKKTLVILSLAFIAQSAQAYDYLKFLYENKSPVLQIHAKDENDEFQQKDRVTFNDNAVRKFATEQVMKTYKSWVSTTCIDKDGEEYDCFSNAALNVQSPNWNGNDYDDRMNYVVRVTEKNLKKYAYDYLYAAGDSVFQCRRGTKTVSGYAFAATDYTIDLYGLNENMVWEYIDQKAFYSGMSTSAVDNEASIKQKEKNMKEAAAKFDAAVNLCNQVIKGWGMETCIDPASVGQYTKYNDGSFPCAKNKYTKEETKKEHYLVYPTNATKYALEQAAKKVFAKIK